LQVASGITSGLLGLRLVIWALVVGKWWTAPRAVVGRTRRGGNLLKCTRPSSEQPGDANPELEAVS